MWRIHFARFSPYDLRPVVEMLTVVSRMVRVGVPDRVSAKQSLFDVRVVCDLKVHSKLMSVSSNWSVNRSGSDHVIVEGVNERRNIPLFHIYLYIILSSKYWHAFCQVMTSVVDVISCEDFMYPRKTELCGKMNVWFLCEWDKSMFISIIREWKKANNSKWLDAATTGRSRAVGRLASTALVPHQQPLRTINQVSLKSFRSWALTQ